MRASSSSQHHVPSPRKTFHEPFPKMFRHGPFIRPITAMTDKQRFAEGKTQKHSDGADISRYGSVYGIGAQSLADQGGQVPDDPQHHRQLPPNAPSPRRRQRNDAETRTSQRGFTGCIAAFGYRNQHPGFGKDFGQCAHLERKTAIGGEAGGGRAAAPAWLVGEHGQTGVPKRFHAPFGFNRHAAAIPEAFPKTPCQSSADRVRMAKASMRNKSNT